jgi:Tol biopolymer transport system component
MANIMRPAGIHVLAFAAVTAAACQDASDPVAPTNATELETPPALFAAGLQGPEIFAPGVISDSRWQWRITFTNDGKTAYFTVSDGFFPITRQATIMVSHQRKNGTWSTPEVAPFSGTYSDIDPFISPDGRRLYFASNRPVDGSPKIDMDLWMVERTPHGWSEPIHLGPEVNSDADELYPSASADGTLYFGSGPLGPVPDADWNIYRARRVGKRFAPREPLSEINTDLPYDPANPQADWEFNPEISRDGHTLIFTSLRPGGYGLGDLYISRFRHGKWTTPVNLGPAVNTANDEFHPTISPDGRYLYFARTIFAPNFVPSDFYRISARALGVKLGGGGKGH